MPDFVDPVPSSAPAASIALSSRDVELTHGELSQAVTAAVGDPTPAPGVITPNQLLLAWARSTRDMAVRPADPFSRQTVLVAALPSHDLATLAAGARSVVRAGGHVHCAHSLAPDQILDAVAEVRATDLVIRTSSLRMIQRALHAELVSGPLAVLAVFEGLQHSTRHTMAERRALLPTVHSRLGARLEVVRCVGDPVDTETETFFSRAGILVREGFR